VRVASATNVLLAAVNVPVTVDEPVVVSVVTVVEPAFIVPVVLTLIVPDKSAVLIEPSAICALPTELAPGVDATPVNAEPSPENPVVAVIVPMTYSAVPGVVVPTPTLPASVIFRIFVVVPTVKSVAGVVVPIPTLPPLATAVNVPVNAMLDAVIEPVLSTMKPPSVTTNFLTVIEPVSSTLKAPLATVNVPVDTVILAAVIEPDEPTTKLLLAAVKVPVTVADPVVVNVDTVVDPAFIVPVVFILLAPPTVAVTPLNAEPSPINPLAVTVPFAKISARKRTVVVP